MSSILTFVLLINEFCDVTTINNNEVSLEHKLTSHFIFTISKHQGSLHLLDTVKARPYST